MAITQRPPAVKTIPANHKGGSCRYRAYTNLNRGGQITNAVGVNDNFIDDGNGYAEQFSMLFVGTGGKVIIESVDYNPVLFATQNGQYIIFAGWRVLDTAIIDGIEQSTTASDITWVGGE